MITDELLNSVKNLQNIGYTIFHNTSGNPIFFRNNIKHISYATNLKMSKKYSKINGIQTNEIIVNDFYVINDKFELIHLTQRDHITIIPLEELK